MTSWFLNLAGPPTGPSAPVAALPLVTHLKMSIRLCALACSLAPGPGLTMASAPTAWTMMPAVLQVRHRCRCLNVTACGDEAGMVEGYARQGLMPPDLQVSQLP